MRHRHGVVDVLGIALRSDIHGNLRERGFQLHDLLGVGGGFGLGFAHELEHVRNVLDILGAGLLRDVSGAKVIVAFGQAEATLIHYSDLLAGVFEVLLFAEVEKCGVVD